jgi:hypothetical protein
MKGLMPSGCKEPVRWIFGSLVFLFFFFIPLDLYVVAIHAAKNSNAREVS